jgi:hypothetical protein
MSWLDDRLRDARARYDRFEQNLGGKVHEAKRALHTEHEDEVHDEAAQDDADRSEQIHIQSPLKRGLARKDEIVQTSSSKAKGGSDDKKPSLLGGVTRLLSARSPQDLVNGARETLAAAKDVPQLQPLVKMVEPTVTLVAPGIIVAPEEKAPPSPPPAQAPPAPPKPAWPPVFTPPAAAAPKPQPPPPPMGPKMVPPDQLHSMDDVKAAIRREEEFLSMFGQVAPTDLRLAHEKYLDHLKYMRATPLVINDGRTLIQKLQDQERANIAWYRDALAKLGDKRGCMQGDTAESLRMRWERLVDERIAASNDAEAKRLYMGLDGKVGTSEELARYELQQRIEAMNPGSGMGIIFAGIAAANGGTVEDIRAAGQAGNVVEGLGGGVGVPLQNNRAGATKDTQVRGARRPSAGPGLGPRARAVNEPQQPIRRAPSSAPSSPPPVVRTAPTTAPPPSYASSARPPVPASNAAPPRITPSAARPAPARSDNTPPGRLAPNSAPPTTNAPPVARSASNAAPPTPGIAPPGADGPVVVRARMKPGTRARIEVRSLPAADQESLRPSVDRRTQARSRINAAQSAVPPDTAAVNRARGDLTTASRDIGEMAADAAVRAHYPGPPPPRKVYPPAGHDKSISGDFDAIYEVTRNGKGFRLVVEAKGAGGRIITKEVAPNQRAEQGTRPYFDKTVQQMWENTNPDRIRRSAQRREAERLMMLNPERDVVYVKIATGVREANGVSQASTITIEEFDLRSENAQ